MSISTPALATAEKQPGVLGFLYGRALQASVRQTWRGEVAVTGWIEARANALLKKGCKT